MAAQSVKAQAHNSATAISSTSAPFIPGADVAPVDIHPPLSVRENNQVAAHAGGVEIAVDVPAAIQPAHILPNGVVNLLRLKCPTIRSYIGTNTTQPTGAALRSGLNRTLAPFENGQENAHQACSTLPGFEQSQFDAEMAAGREPTTPCYTCEQARVDGATTCPTGGCVMPDGTTTNAPVDLLVWDCKIKAVGHITIANSIVASEFATKLISVRDKIFAYDQGIYKEVNHDALIRKILPHLGPMGTVKQAEAIGTTLRVANVRHMDFITPNSNVICFKNGTLNVATRLLESHSPGHMLLNRIDYDYIADAACPGFMAFLESIWVRDSDREQKITFIREWLGYLLVADTRMQKMLILKGEGANGKSVLMDVVRGMIGEINTTSVMLDRLRMPYVRATMEGRLLNQSADLPKRGIVSDGDLKAIISGDPIEASPKLKPSYTIKTYVRMMVATNNMPNSRDTSDGYIRRLIILGFNRQFSEAERNPHLLQSLLQEMPGIIAWAVGGLYQLREQGRFTIPSSSEQAVQTYREDISPVRLFAEECLVPSPDRLGFLSKDLFMAYRSWCRDRGFDAGNMIIFGRELAMLGFEQRKSGSTWWRVRVTAAGQDYFSPARAFATPAEIAAPQSESSHPLLA